MMKQVLKRHNEIRAMHGVSNHSCVIRKCSISNIHIMTRNDTLLDCLAYIVHWLLVSLYELFLNIEIIITVMPAMWNQWA
jgi:hypothetical protein